MIHCSSTAHVYMPPLRVINVYFACPVVCYIFVSWCVPVLLPFTLTPQPCVAHGCPPCAWVFFFWLKRSLSFPLSQSDVLGDRLITGFSLQCSRVFILLKSSFKGLLPCAGIIQLSYSQRLGQASLMGYEGSEVVGHLTLNDYNRVALTIYNQHPVRFFK